VRRSSPPPGQAALLLGVGSFVIIEGILRLFGPPAVGGTATLRFGVIGPGGNTVALIVLASGRNLTSK
jgi:cobalt-zinc-cadmium efflux system protein